MKEDLFFVFWEETIVREEERESKSVIGEKGKGESFFQKERVQTRKRKKLFSEPSLSLARSLLVSVVASETSSSSPSSLSLYKSLFGKPGFMFQHGVNDDDKKKKK